MPDDETTRRMYKKFVEPSFDEIDRLPVNEFVEYFKHPAHHYMSHEDGFISWCDLGRGIVGIHFLVVQLGRRGWGNGRRLFGQWNTRMKRPKTMLESKPDTVGFWKKMGFHEVPDYEYVVPAEVTPTGEENRSLTLMVNFDMEDGELEWMVGRWFEEGYGTKTGENPAFV